MNDRLNPSVNAAARAAAQSKKASDYEAPSDFEDKRTASEIEKDLQRVREELTATVDELAARLSPDRLKEDLKANAKVKAAEGKVKAQALVSQAKAGDKKSIGILAGAAAAAVLLVVKAVKR